jgi:SAM-dependent methyltransferase
MKRRMLHIGCGTTPLPEPFASEFDEIRVDIDPAVKPDIVAGMTDLGQIGEYEALYCCHALEHLYPYEVLAAVKEFARVLKPGGFAVVVVPDLEGVKPNDEPISDDPKWAGVTGLHLLYGKSTAETPWMAHHSGFIESTLRDVMVAAFAQAKVSRDENFQLVAVGVKC